MILRWTSVALVAGLLAACPVGPQVGGRMAPLQLVAPPRASSRVTHTLPVRATVDVDALRSSVLGDCEATVAPDFTSVSVRATTEGLCSIDLLAETESGVHRASATVLFVDVPPLGPSDFDPGSCWEEFVEVGPNIACLVGNESRIFGAGLQRAIPGRPIAALDDDHALVLGEECLVIDAVGDVVATLGRPCPDGLRVQRHRNQPRVVFRDDDGFHAYTWTGAAFEPAPIAEGLPTGAIFGDWYLADDGRVLDLVDGSTVVEGIEAGFATHFAGESFLLQSTALKAFWLPEHLRDRSGQVLAGNAELFVSGLEGIGHAALLTVDPFREHFSLELVDLTHGLPQTVAIGWFPGRAPAGGRVMVGRRLVRFDDAVFEAR